VGGECMGTMAPLCHDGTAAARCAACEQSLGECQCTLCNRCGDTRTEARFLQRVEEHFACDEEEHDHAP
jgi:hypothetical protein